jgi:micrococcal nuclease
VEENQGDDNEGTQTETAQEDTFVVTRVVDGDTIEAQAGATILDVRLIGVDTPETVHPSKPVQCFGPKASTFTKNQLEGKQVRLEFDVERKDRYGRTLAYAWVGNRMFNETLVAKGYGQVATYPPNVKYVDRFIAAQRAARDNDRGLWKTCRGGGNQSGGTGNADTTENDSGGNCDPNYQGACIPPYPPDLNCDDVSAAGFQSVGSDPHGFDGDADGIACE